MPEFTRPQRSEQPSAEDARRSASPLSAEHARDAGERDVRSTGRAAGVLGMQRVAGNQVVSRAIGASRSAALQRYVVVETRKQKPGYWQGENAPLRVSDDGAMAVRHGNGVPDNTLDFQVFYALPNILQQSAQALLQTGSAFTIAAGNDTIVGSSPTQKNAPQQTLNKAVVANQDLARIGKGDFTFNSCSANLMNFLGVLRGLPTDNLKLERKRDLIVKLEGTLDHDKKTINTGDIIDRTMLEARQVATGQDTNSGAREAYEAMKESMRKQVSEQFGVDEHAVPEPGEGFGIIRGGKGGRDGMGHFAPVVAKSGDDRVTLENDVSQKQGQEKPKIGDINPNWYMRMFGTVKKHWYGNDDQTFWGEAKKYEKGDFGDKPLVATIGSQAQQQQEEDDD